MITAWSYDRKIFWDSWKSFIPLQEGLSLDVTRLQSRRNFRRNTRYAMPEPWSFSLYNGFWYLTDYYYYSRCRTFVPITMCSMRPQSVREAFNWWKLRIWVRFSSLLGGAVLPEDWPADFVHMFVIFIVTVPTSLNFTGLMNCVGILGPKQWVGQLVWCYS